MDTILFPRPRLLTKTFLEKHTAERDLVVPVYTTNPANKLPPRWVRVESNGGPRVSMTLWECQLVLYIYDSSESSGEVTSNLIHSLMLDAACVPIALPGEEPYPWVWRSQYVSGPSDIGDEDLPRLKCYRSAITWTLLPIPKE